MSRGTANFTAQLTQKVVEPRLAVELFFDTETIRMWNGVDDIVYDSNTFIGASNLISITPSQETTEVSAKSITISVNGISSDLISNALTENYRGRQAKIYLWFMSSGSIVDAPYEVFSGYMDMMTVSDDGEFSTINLNVESKLIDLQRPRNFRYTGEDQKIYYPSDLGLDFVTSIQDAEIKWGS